MARPKINSISLCSGVGGLDLGADLAFDYLGYDYRTIAYGEWEAFAASQFIALMEAGCLDAAPVWCGDFRRINAKRFRGKVDCITAGFPCQDISIAGKRAGLDGKRSGLFFDILNIADDCGARMLILENVSAITTATATVVDTQTGEQWEERASARIMGELADCGWDAEWTHVRASDVGASHRRERWFCFAWRMGDSDQQRTDRPRASGSKARLGEPQDAINSMVHPRYEQRRERYEQNRPGSTETAELQKNNRPSDGSLKMEDPQYQQRQRERVHAGRRPEGAGENDSGRAGEPLAYAKCSRWPQAGCRLEKHARGEPVPGRSNVADTGDQGLQGSEQRGTLQSNGGGQEAHGSTEQLCGALPLFAPGPSDPRWPDILQEYPGLAPATESGLRMPTDELALVVDESRAHQLRAIGNGVVPSQAAAALVELIRRSGKRSITVNNPIY